MFTEVMMLFSTKYFSIVDDHNFIEGKGINVQSFDEIISEVSKELNVKIPTDKLIQVFITQGTSQAYDNKLYICGNSNYEESYFKMLFKHELIHLIVFTWGIAPIIFWEGIPIYFADNKYRNNSYHKYSKAFLNNGALYNLKHFIMGYKYLGRRFDFRIDMECGSFIGYLFEKYGIEKFKEVFQSFPPLTPENPTCAVNTALSKVYGKKLSDLEKEWISFLNNEVESDDLIEEEIKNKNFYKRIPIKLIHCKFCYFPMEKKNMICPTCGGNNEIKISLK